MTHRFIESYTLQRASSVSSVRDELVAAASDLRGGFDLGGWSCLEIPLAEWLEATAERVGSKSWTGSREALRIARLINGRAS